MAKFKQYVLNFISNKLPAIFLFTSVTYLIFIIRFIIIYEIKLSSNQYSSSTSSLHSSLNLQILLYFWYIISFLTQFYWLKTKFYKHTFVDFDPNDKRINWNNGKWKLCALCDNQGARPKNTIHCKKCGKCRFDLDHHCVWQIIVSVKKILNNLLDFYFLLVF